MKFGKIDKLVLFGGAPLLAAFAASIDRKKTDVTIFACPRHLEEIIPDWRLSLRRVLMALKIRFFETSDINRDKRLKTHVDSSTLGIGVGEVWSFGDPIIKMFGGKLLDFMGIPLPQFRGGAHYTWQILSNNRLGACNLQVINKDMVPAKFDSGEIVKRKEFRFPRTARTPQDYFDHALKVEVAFLKEFLRELDIGIDFKPVPIDEKMSILFPRLNTKAHGYINWQWPGKAIDRFICAFDEPYPGASTFLNAQRVFLKDSAFSQKDGLFHPFQSGLIYRIDKRGCFISVPDGSLIVKDIRNEGGKNLTKSLHTGDRLYTPAVHLEKSMLFNAEYDKHEKK